MKNHTYVTFVHKALKEKPILTGTEYLTLERGTFLVDIVKWLLELNGQELNMKGDT